MGGMGNDPIMLELFRAELDQHVPVLSEGLLALERGRATRADIESMMRAAHSIKGAGRIMGVEPVVRVSHALEDCFSNAKDARIALTPDSVDVLLAGVDAIQRLCSPDPGDAADEALLTALLKRIAVVGAATSSRPAPKDPVGSLNDKNLSKAPNKEATIEIPADLDGDGARQLRQDLLERFDAHVAESGPIQLDFAGTKRIGPEGLAVLLFLDPERSVMPSSSRITACGVNPSMRALLRVTGLDGVLAIVD